MDIGDLVNLWYLNFSHTDKKLPINLKNLVNLRFLILDMTDFLFGNLKIYQILCVCSYSIFFLHKYLRRLYTAIG